MSARELLFLVAAIAGWGLWARERFAPPPLPPPPAVAPAPRPVPAPAPEPLVPERELVSRVIGPDAAEDPGSVPVGADMADEGWGLLRASVLRQSRITLPHDLPETDPETATFAFEEAQVVRVEPDGIHVRHVRGLTKLPYEAMPTDWRERYHIESASAQTYRAWVRRQRETAPVPAVEPAALTAVGTAEERGEAWLRHDQEMAEYHRQLRRYNLALERRQPATRPTRPQPPPFPRPEEP